MIHPEALVFFEDKPTEIWAALVAGIVSLLICLLNGLWLDRRTKKVELSHATILETVKDRLDQAKSEALAELNKGLAEEMEIFKKQLEAQFAEADKRKEALEEISKAAENVQAAARGLVRTAHLPYEEHSDELMEEAIAAFGSMTKYFDLVERRWPAQDSIVFIRLQKAVIAMFIELDFRKGDDPEYIRVLKNACNDIEGCVTSLQEHCDAEKIRAFHSESLKRHISPDRHQAANA